MATVLVHVIHTSCETWSVDVDDEQLAIAQEQGEEGQCLLEQDNREVVDVDDENFEIDYVDTINWDKSYTDINDDIDNEDPADDEDIDENGDKG
ncbi:MULTISPECIES: hypothetical protein [unclassified Bifidobacterium]|uniref:hypothetical protein n=1 Tax=unclassified Bifidobacterium TaxID=2608897 RepID=UPI0023F9DF6C|nr:MULTISPECIES: hypothetical protein [unclassified Bifidobacterium]WEV66400.1 hypothetical protein OZX71_03400 [Bifidobacterium sp. ESL0764]WEV76320.1 hypothetical protein OZX75_03830 [Bifidobacterium sp. ESL0800]